MLTTILFLLTILFYVLGAVMLAAWINEDRQSWSKGQIFVTCLIWPIPVMIGVGIGLADRMRNL